MNLWVGHSAICPADSCIIKLSVNSLIKISWIYDPASVVKSSVSRGKNRKELVFRDFLTSDSELLSGVKGAAFHMVRRLSHVALVLFRWDRWASESLAISVSYQLGSYLLIPFFRWTLELSQTQESTGKQADKGCWDVELGCPWPCVKLMYFVYSCHF